jgi:hypothetical protein
LGSGDYVLGQIMTSVNFDTGALTSGGGVALGGSSHLILNQDGSYVFSGTWHDSGAIGYDESFAWGVKDANNQVYTFARAGSTGGTFTSGSRDGPWSITGTSSAISDNWLALCAGGPTAVWQDAANADLSSIVNTLLSGIQAAAGVVAAVFAVAGPIAAAAA